MRNNTLVYGTRLFKFNQLLLLSILIWAPIPMGSNREWSSAFLILWICLITFFWAINLLRYPPYFSKLKFNRFFLILPTLLILAQLWISIQWFLGIDYDTARYFQSLYLGIAYSLFFILLIVHFSDRKSLTVLVSVMVASGAFQAFYGTAVVLNAIPPVFFDKQYFLSTATGTFVNRNHFAGYLEMTIALGIGLMLALRDGKVWNWKNILNLLVSKKMVIRFALVIMVIGLVMSHSRMGNAAFFSSLILIGSVYVLSLKEHRVRNLLFLIGFIVIDLLIISHYFGLEKLKDRIIHSNVVVEVQEGKMMVDIKELRGHIFNNSIELLSQSPLAGVGAGGYETAFEPYAGPNFYGRVDHAHNDYLELLIELGVIGVIPLVLFVLISIVLAIKSLLKRRSYYRSGLGFGAAMAMLAILIHSTVDFNLQIPANALTFISVCAIAFLSVTHVRKHNKPVIKKRKLRR